MVGVTVGVGVVVVVGVAVVAVVVAGVAVGMKTKESMMKKIVNVVEVDGEGLVSLLGEEVILFCINYSYAGKLAGVNAADVLLENARFVYETGAFGDAKWKDAQPVGKPLYVRVDKIESYCLGKP